ncbi:unnamed protein product [Orchesella dallaii]|uniref:Uncharacterized protein n=1 Tax=Orchesella dallaii TaxID=48710 RepID=A0ABP1PZ41_9HEXA
MVPPPRPRCPEYVENSEHVRLPVPLNRGNRRNFAEERYRIPHRYPVGTKVYLQQGISRVPSGPMYVKEHCSPMLPHGLPQYILQPLMYENSAVWIHVSEGNVYELDGNGDRIW